MAQESVLDRARRYVREHERGLIVAWLATLLLLVGVAFGWGLWQRGAERVVDAFEARWPAAIEASSARLASARAALAAAADDAQRRLAEERVDAELARLEELDARFPARSVVHRFDKQRERLLELLANGYAESDRKRRSLAACERLVLFDPRNWNNHWVKAQIAQRFGEDELARAALDALLAIHPTHLPAVEARIRMAFDGGDFAQVPPLWRAYVDAYRLAPIDFRFAGLTLQLEVPADGRAQRFEVACALAERARGEARFDTHGWSLDVRAIAFLEPQRAGVAGTPRLHEVPNGAWSAQGGAQLEPGCLRAESADSSLRRELDGPEAGAARAVFELVAYKACSATLWRMVSTSYANLLAWDELEGMRARTRVGGCLEAGSIFAD